MIGIDQEIVDGYTDGEIVVMNFRNEEIHRGPISKIELIDRVVKVECHWMAVSGHYPAEGNWSLSDKTSHEMELLFHDTTLPGFGRLSLQSLATQEVIVLFGKDDKSRLRPTEVANLA